MSTIIADNLTGKTSAGSVTVTSEGGAATMQLQQGLAKAWVNFDGTGTIATRDSLNIASLTDNSTGYYGINISSAMANINYSTTSTGGQTSGTGNRSILSATTGAATTSVSVTTVVSSNLTYNDTIVTQLHIMGDLA